MQQIESHRVVGFVKCLNELSGVVVRLFGDVQVLDEGRGLDEEEEAHQRLEQRKGRLAMMDSSDKVTCMSAQISYT